MRARSDQGARLSVVDVSHTYHGVEVLRDVSLQLEAGRTLAVVGESGAGKSTLSRIVAGLERPRQGQVLIDGVPPRLKSGTASPVQMVFQQPGEALNRFATVGRNVADAMSGHPRATRLARVAELLELVGIDSERASDKPRAFSGGQLQRIVLARALAPDPKLLICDEPTSALDVRVQAQIVNLLLRLQAERGFACMLVTHDLGVARVLADEILVLRNGEVVEQTSNEAFFSGPEHPYARELLTATSEQMVVTAPPALLDG
jgi:ABC-type dipeptide/oligopeptide/nickel transport system ATPase subunit